MNQNTINPSIKTLSTKGLLNLAINSFSNITSDDVTWKSRHKNGITNIDCLMSGLAIFSLKYPSLLQFNNDYRNDEHIQNNLKNLYGINRAPSDTYMRERLDNNDPKKIRIVFKQIFAELQRSKKLEDFVFFNGYYLLSVDGTGFFSSESIYCESCCVKNHRNGSKTYYHQMLSGSLVSPNQKIVIPFAPEPIIKSDGMCKNDCEYNAFIRFINDFRREHPHLKVIVLLDSLFSRGPIIKKLVELGLGYIIGVKEEGNIALFEKELKKCEIITKTRSKKASESYSGIKKITEMYKFVNNVSINDSNQDIKVNFLDYSELDENGKVLQHFSWITHINLSEQTVVYVMKGGRARWKIENETFNTLKNQGYNFEHNFGHGYKNLSTIMAMLMLLAFMIDQIQQLCDKLFQEALAKKIYKRYLWEALRNMFMSFIIKSWEDVWNSMIHGIKKSELTHNYP